MRPRISMRFAQLLTGSMRPRISMRFAQLLTGSMRPRPIVARFASIEFLCATVLFLDVNLPPVLQSGEIADRDVFSRGEAGQYRGAVAVGCSEADRPPFD